MIKLVSTIVFFAASMLLTLTAVNYSQKAYSDYQIKRLPVQNNRVMDNVDDDSYSSQSMDSPDVTNYNEATTARKQPLSEEDKKYNQLLAESELLEFDDSYINKGEELKSAYLDIGFLNKEAAIQSESNNSVNNSQGIDYQLDNLGENANFSGSKTWLVKNNQNESGRLLIGLSDLVNWENGCNEQEKLSDKNCSKIKDKGELGGKIKLIIAVNGVDKVNSLLLESQQNKISSDWNKLPPVIIRPRQSVLITAYWSVGENDYGNEIQGDGVEFKVNFRMVRSN